MRNSCKTSELIVIENLSMEFQNGYKGLNDINLTIHKGEFVVFAGRNGSGKSLLASHIAGLYTAMKGDVKFEGVSLAKNPDITTGRIGLIFQDADSQILGETVYDDITIGPKNIRMSKEDIKLRSDEALQWAELESKASHRPLTLSGGEKRRLAIAGMLALNCDIFIFDEPFANLDYPSICHVLESLIKLHEEGKTIILLTHELEKVLAYATRLVIIESGEIVYDNAVIDIERIPFEKYGLRHPFVHYSEVGDLTWLK